MNFAGLKCAPLVRRVSVGSALPGADQHFRCRSMVRSPESGRRGFLCIASTVAVLLGMCLLAANATAATSHVFKKTIGAESSTPVAPYPISGPTGVGVDQSSHDIYVTDPGNYRVEKFTEGGEFILMFGKDVNKHGSTETEKDVCLKGQECQPGVSGENPGAFELPYFISIDNSCSQHQPPLTGAACEEFVILLPQVMSISETPMTPWSRSLILRDM